MKEIIVNKDRSIGKYEKKTPFSFLVLFVCAIEFNKDTWN